ncbi:hypothetical protein NDU88_003826 [Pleurodeles waltl]|uniref:Uncharacterized protein n=1 Tax=Pleurodeles waltl TaxID=8319 RepID=A0AAV7T7D6_PLEWA|nr:hypothetical protein NDU88_003826 [Pleurodeles waltl]
MGVSPHDLGRSAHNNPGHTPHAPALCSPLSSDPNISGPRAARSAAGATPSGGGHSPTSLSPLDQTRLRACRTRRARHREVRRHQMLRSLPTLGPNVSGLRAARSAAGATPSGGGFSSASLSLLGQTRLRFHRLQCARYFEVRRRVIIFCLCKPVARSKTSDSTLAPKPPFPRTSGLRENVRLHGHCSQVVR